MKKIFYILIALLGVVFVIIQFFQPDRNEGEITKTHLFQQVQVPDEVETILQNACLDCHSNTTNYLWYHKVSPISRMVNKHVVEGKDELNLSDWGEFDFFEKITTLEEICREIERKSMPLKSYTVMHPKAKLSEEQVAAICKWSEELGEKLLAESEE